MTKYPNQAQTKSEWRQTTKNNKISVLLSSVQKKAERNNRMSDGHQTKITSKYQTGIHWKIQ